MVDSPLATLWHPGGDALAGGLYPKGARQEMPPGPRALPLAASPQMGGLALVFPVYFLVANLSLAAPCSAPDGAGSLSAAERM